MSSFEPPHYYSTGLTSTHSNPADAHSFLQGATRKELEKLALIVAQTWLDDHPNAQPSSQADFQSCLQYVTQQLAEAGTAVGGFIGLAISVGGGSAAAEVACRQMFSSYTQSSSESGVSS